MQFPGQSSNTVIRKLLIATLWLASAAAAAQDMDYPRQVSIDAHSLKVHHPVIDRWENWEWVEGWVPVEVRLQGSDRQWVGAVRARAHTAVDIDRRLVTLSGQQVLKVRFTEEGAPPDALELAGRAVRDRPHTVTLDELLQVLAPDFEVPQQGRNPAGLGYDPPRIVVSERPMQLLLIDRQPVRAPITGTALEFVVNTDWPLFYLPPANNWYVLNQGVWQTNSLLSSGGWTTTDKLPGDFQTLAMSDAWPLLREAMPPRLPDSEPAPFLVSLEPTELIVTRGPPVLQPVGGAGLNHVVNTERDLFELAGRWYFLASGRWFRASDLKGRWAHVEDLPEVFAAIPPEHARAHVRAAVPGTEEAILAMMEASLPRRRTVGPEDAGNLSVGYVGAPQFEPVEGTTLQRAVNSPYHIIRHNNFYYLCANAAWFFARQPEGPWSVALEVPAEIYRIPATDPAHPVTYVVPVRQASSPGGRATFSHNGGYLGEYSTGVTVVHGTGWYYSPWLWRHPAGYPVYWGYPHTYGWHVQGGGNYSQRFYHYGGYWGRQSITIESPPRGIHGGPADHAFLDPGVARRGSDYSTLDEQRDQALARAWSADDDLYADADGDVYRREAGRWSQHSGGEWSTMAALERQYGTTAGTVGQAGPVEPGQPQAYRQNPEDIERMERYYQSRLRSYNMYGTITVGH